MKDQLRAYINTIFADAERRAPYSRPLAELKEEMLQNLYDKYDDLVASGKSPAAAYNAAVAGVGDISDLLDEVVGSHGTGNPSGAAAGASTHDSAGPSAGPSAGASDGPRPHNIYTRPPLTPEEEARLKKYQARAAVLKSVAVALYILCWVPLAVLEGLLGGIGETVGLPVMFIMIAAATAMMIYVGNSKPTFAAGAPSSARDGDDDDGDDDDDDDDDDGGDPYRDRKVGRDGRPPRSPVYKAISGALWILTVCGYLLLSFATGRWEVTWMLYLVTAAVDNVIKACFDLRR